MKLFEKWIARLGDDDKALQSLRRAAADFDDAMNELESAPDADRAKEVAATGKALEREIDAAEKAINPRLNRDAAKAIAEIRKERNARLATVDDLLKAREGERAEQARKQEDLAGNEDKVASVERTRMLLKKVDASGMAFALALNPGEYNQPVLSLWPGKDPKALGAMLKKSLKAKKCTFGTARLNGSALELTDQAAAVSGLARHVKAFLSANKPMPFTQAVVRNAKGEDITAASEKVEREEFAAEVKEASQELAVIAKAASSDATVAKARKELEKAAQETGEVAEPARKFLARLAALDKEHQEVVQATTRKLATASKEGPNGKTDLYALLKTAGQPLGELHSLAQEALDWLKQAEQTGKASTLSVDQRLDALERSKRDLTAWVKEAKAQQQEALPALSRVTDNGDAEQREAAKPIRDELNQAFKALVECAQSFAKAAKSVTTDNLLDTFMPAMRLHDQAMDLRRDVRLQHRRALELAKAVVYPES